MQNISNDLRVDNLVTPQNASGGTVNTNASGYKSMANYRDGMVIVTAELTNGKTCVAQLTQSTAAAAADKANVSGKTVTLIGATNFLHQVGVIDFAVNDLDLVNAKIYVGCDLTSNQSGDVVSAVLVRGNARYFMGNPGTPVNTNMDGGQQML